MASSYVHGNYNVTHIMVDRYKSKHYETKGLNQPKQRHGLLWELSPKNLFWF